MGALVDGKYRLGHLLGEGAIGAVFEAEHVSLHRRFALKLLKAPHDLDPEFLRRFRREAEALGRLRHPNIVDVTDFGVDASTGRPYLVMERLEGRTLADETAGSPLPWDRARAILQGVAAALDHAHARGVLHRDVKPGNVILCGGSSGSSLPKVVDFGLAAWREPAPELPSSDPPPRPAGAPGPRDSDDTAELTETGGIIGTLRYASPEVLRGEPATTASDRYSFGVLAYEVLVGRPPFDGGAREVLAGHLNQPIPEPSRLGVALPAEVTAALRAALEKDPASRPATTTAVVAAIGRGWGAAERRRWRSVEAPRRMLLGALVAVAATLASASFERSGAGMAAQRWLHDRLLAVRPTRPPDPRLLLVSVDEASLAADPTPLTERAGEFSAAVQGMLEAGARGVALDFLLPARWRESKAFADLVLTHGDRLVLAAMWHEGPGLVGPECLHPLTTVALGPEGTSRLFGLVNLDEDPDGVVRRGRWYYRDEAAGLRPSWAAAAARLLEGSRAGEPAFWIDHAMGWSRVQRVAWHDTPARLARDPRLFEGRLVLVGGDFVGSGDDAHRIPRRAGRPSVVSGLVLQALMIDTVLQGLPVRDASPWPSRAGAFVITAVAAALLLCGRRVAALVTAAVAVVAFVGGAFLLARSAGRLWPVVGPVSAVAAGIVLAMVLRWKVGEGPGGPGRDG